jgi:hypothetical protein
VWQPPWLLESAIGKGEGLTQLGIFAYVRQRTRVQHHAGNTFFGKHFRGHAAGMAGANNQYIDFVQHVF